MHSINTQDTGSFTKSLQIVTIPDQEQIPHLSQNRSTGRSVMGLGADPAFTGNKIPGDFRVREA